ncbi:hypothetical protein MGG_15205 [Pyricularia oryzae 70-15]|uniref:Aminoglycoside phosphotransferase domain-containing protein n=1 Tax=Pyricularia oryzae (strain 70-15 / ATCC MYA-4617 / FGSC 8958) TaxID=242507 RepID=G4N1L1_PYRO7|nr:uncharacterized protein MGG_15205 [Pyricularia oryzae 70-15]EHA51583.1 hypothetical protein MGG_15205 [Pyricularia oryzae 70-15]
MMSTFLSCSIPGCAKPSSQTRCTHWERQLSRPHSLPGWFPQLADEGRRVTSCAFGLPESLAGYLISSEYATLKFLETTAVPAPQDFAFGVRDDGTDHGVGLGFLLMEELSGKSWQGDGIDGKLATEDDKTRVLQGLADIMAELAAHPFPKARSLTLQGSYIQVSAVARDSTSTTKGDHLLVDDDFNITRIIDRGMARVVPSNEASSLSLVTADMSSLCNGRASLSDDDVALARVLTERSYFQMAGCMGDDKIRRFFWGLALEPKWSYGMRCHWLVQYVVLRVFGVDQEWTEYLSDERLQGLLARTGSAVP